MKKFKDFIKLPDVIKSIPFAIHFRYQGKDEENVTHKIKSVPFAIHFRNQKTDLKEENLDHHKDHYDIGEILHYATANHLSDDEISHIENYTKSSTHLNRALIRGAHPLDRSDEHETITRNARPSGHSVTLYSGTKGVDFGALARSSKGGILHSPAHISASHSKEVAKDYSIDDSSSSRNMLKIRVRPRDKILHVSEISHMGRHEHETIIPAGTKLKYSHTKVDKKDGTNIHHFSIHSQEDHKPLPKPTSKDIDHIFKHHGDAENRPNFAISRDKAVAITKYPHLIQPHHIESAIHDKNGGQTSAPFHAATHEKATKEHISQYIDKHDTDMMYDDDKRMGVMSHPNFDKNHLHQLVKLSNRSKYSFDTPKLRASIMTHPLRDESHLKALA